MQTLKEIRERYKGMTVAKLAQESGVNAVTLWRLENGKNRYRPHEETQRKVARVLAVHPDEIVEFANLPRFMPPNPKQKRPATTTITATITIAIED